jgi:major membrane immunogen (membrane-anchored lipoprotein)
MMKYFIIMVAAMLLNACGNLLNDSNVFQSGKLKGKYKVDLTHLWQKQSKLKKEMINGQKWVKG